MTTIITKTTLGTTVNGAISNAISFYGKALESQFKSALNVALLRGVEIPAYTVDGTVFPAVKLTFENDKPLSVRDLADKLCKDNVKISKSTVSDYENAVKWIIDHNVFDMYNNGQALFSIRALRVLWSKDNESAVADYISNHGIDDLLTMTDSELTAIFKKSDDGQTSSKGKKSESKSESNDNESESDNGNESENDEITTFELDGKKYEVAKSILDEFLAKCSEVADDTELTA